MLVKYDVVWSGASALPSYSEWKFTRIARQMLVRRRCDHGVNRPIVYWTSAAGVCSTWRHHTRESPGYIPAVYTVHTAILYGLDYVQTLNS